MRQLSLTSLASVVLVVLFFVVGNDQTAGCPTPATETANVCMYKWPHGCCVSDYNRIDYVIRPGIGAYKLFKHQVTWNTARDTCVRDGGQLPVIDTAEKEEVFHSWVKNETLRGIWIGIHDLFEEGQWVTLNGDPVVTMSYYPWAEGEPNNLEDGEHCAALWKTGSKGIYDVPCTDKYSFICEINVCEDLESVCRRLTVSTDSESLHKLTNVSSLDTMRLV